MNFCNNVIEPKPGIRKKQRKRKKGAQKKEGGGGENSPISPPLDPRLLPYNKDKGACSSHLLGEVPARVMSRKKGTGDNVLF